MKSTLLSFRFLALVTLGLASVHVLPGASIQVNTTFALPAASSQPLIWPASVASLQARATDPLYSGYSNNVRSYVNGQLGSLASQTNEDTLASIAKGAAILERLGETPPNTYASYALVATTAISRMGSRAAWILFQPSNRFQHIYDSGRLQSMAEAFDLLRGSANLTATNISTMRSKITQWADAGRNNLELNTFHPDDNYALKFGSALVTTALALRDSSTANTWLTKGKTLVNAALNRMADETGWYRESSWYANYSLNNLVSTAHHVKNATGGSVNWFTNLKPLFTFALFTRQPDGSNTPFEEGLRTYLTPDLVWGEYTSTTLGSELRWSRNNLTASPISSNFENNQYHTATRFLAVDNSVVAAAPVVSPTCFLSSADVEITVLRSAHGTSGRQATLIAATDHSSDELIDTRHNSRNPLDMVIYDGGESRVVTSGGGPNVTSSTNRAYYINTVTGKNIPTVNGNTSYVSNGANISASTWLDSIDEGGQTNRFADLSTTTVAGINGSGNTVARTLAMIDESYFVVLDRFTNSAQATNQVNWHPVGTRTQVSSASDLLQYRWDKGTKSCDVFMAGSSSLTGNNLSGYYAETFGGAEQTISGLQGAQTSNGGQILTILSTRDTAATGIAASRLSTSAANAHAVELQVPGGYNDILTFTAAPGTDYDAGAITTDAAFAAVRDQGGVIVSFALVNGSVVHLGGAPIFESSTAAPSISATFSSSGIVAQVDSDASSPRDYHFGYGGVLSPSATYTGYQDGVALSASQFYADASGLHFIGISGGGTLRVTTQP
ncbi:heparinase II/III family protein [Roseimicrobium sp. ORNL1]|uniref:heparinase II/III family protein n=1 Tax=Roseimicrobium sp. ORNL1 TaxID=2711231 RepID=UPI0013E148C1|nr:heparinase II/III family protein [Roseimicrobium sp. ORNL1]QIF03929.1 hypothetical protein G5S37_21150 [Roseimicrobium sp. ORNL1]